MSAPSTIHPTAHHTAPSARTESRLAAVEVQLASQALTIDALVRTIEDLSDAFKRAVTRLDAAERGVRLGRPPGSRGSAASPSPAAARDASELDFRGGSTPHVAEGQLALPALRGSDESILECIVESAVNYLVSRNVPSATVSILDLEANARAYQADLGRGWPFTSSKHFARRFTMAAPTLLGQGVQATRFRSTFGKLFWRLDMLAADGNPIATSEPAAPEPETPEDQQASGT